MARDRLLGIDLGTSSVKAGLFTLDGGVLRVEATRSTLRSPEPGAAEQDPDEWWQAIGEVARAVLNGQDASRLAAIGVGGHGPTAVAVDEDLLPTCPAVTWMDGRAEAEAREIYGRLGQPVPVWGSWPARALWIARHRPEAFRRTRWLFQTWDYLAARLTGTPCQAAMVAEAEIEAAGLDPRLIPPPTEPLRAIGQVTARAGRETGLPPGTPVVAGAVDGILGVIGSGAVRVGRACINAGTSGTFTTIVAPPLGWPVLGLQFFGAGINTYGKALAWFEEQVAHEDGGVEAVLSLAGRAPVGSDGLLFLPYLAGERAPHFDSRARGAFLGLTLAHDRAHLTRAVLEGVAFACRQVLESVEAAGAHVEEVRVVGGAARSDVWNQVQADVLGRPVLRPVVAEGPLMGAAVVAGVGVGCFPGIPTAADRMVRIERRFDPRPTSQARYDELYAVYAQAYPALKELHWRLGDIALHADAHLFSVPA